MPPGKYSVLRSQTRKMVYSVLQFMKKESEKGLQLPLKAVYKRVAMATGVSPKTVQRISSEPSGAKESGSSAVFRTPGKKRKGKKRITDLDNFDQGVIKRCVHNFQETDKELPTVKKLQKKLKADINFNGSLTSLSRILKKLGFEWKRAQNERQVLIEKSNIRQQRIEYLRKIAKFRAEGRPIIYTDQTYVESTQSTSNGTQRIVIVHAGSESGFVPKALLTFKVCAKNYHDINMNFNDYEIWVRTKLLPNLPANSVVVVDNNNASYHSKEENPAPSSNAKKAEMQSWLSNRNISYDDFMYKPELYQLILDNRERNKTFIIDKLLKDNTHEVLRLPPYDRDLNPITMAWAAIKHHVAKHNIKWNANAVTNLIKEKVSQIGENEWGAFCQTIQKIEEEYKKSDAVMDRLTEEYIIPASDSEAEGESEASECEEEDDSDDSVDNEPCIEMVMKGSDVPIKKKPSTCEEAVRKGNDVSKKNEPCREIVMEASDVTIKVEPSTYRALVTESNDITIKEEPICKILEGSNVYLKDESSTYGEVDTEDSDNSTENEIKDEPCDEEVAGEIDIKDEHSTIIEVADKDNPYSGGGPRSGPPPQRGGLPPSRGGRMPPAPPMGRSMPPAKTKVISILDRARSAMESSYPYDDPYAQEPPVSGYSGGGRGGGNGGRGAPEPDFFYDRNDRYYEDEPPPYYKEPAREFKASARDVGTRRAPNQRGPPHYARATPYARPPK